MKINQDIFLSIRSQSRKRIAEFFIRSDLAISEREIGKLLGIPSMTTHRILKNFEELHLISISRVGTANVWKVNKGSYAYHMYKQLFHFYKSAPSPIETLKEVLVSHLSLTEIKKVILYGPVARGKEKQNSDINVCIIVATQQAKENIKPAVDKASLKCLDLFGNRLETYVLTEEEYGSLQDKELARTINKGIEVDCNERKALNKTC